MSTTLFDTCSIDTTFFANVSTGCYEEENFTQIESDILFYLNWYLHCPTAFSFFDHFVSLDIDCSKVIDSIESCMYFSIHGSDVDNLANNIFGLLSKTGEVIKMT